VLSAIMFFPRGGSAHAARGLAQRLPDRGWRVVLVAGSCSTLSAYADARSFYAGIDVRPVEFDGDAPMHPSFEERADGAEPVFAALGHRDCEHQVSVWARALADAGAADADVIHLHHLTPLNEAAFRVAPRTPVIGQLHGTELLMLERIEAGNPDGWRHADEWRARMIGWAGRCERILVAPGGAERAAGLLELEHENLLEVSNGFDATLFKPGDVDREAQWRRHLGAVPPGVVLAYVGRFTDVKRVPMLVRAFAGAEPRFNQPASLVLIGGYPGETEGEHPADTIRATGARNAYLAGWHPHDDLPGFLRASDAIVLPSAREQFGQALVEGMACGLPAIATRSFGPGSIVDDGRSGWLVEPDDEDALSAALVAAVNDDTERRRRGAAARETVCERYAWSVVADRIARVLSDVAEAAPPEQVVASVTTG
jgi:glycosyltransferase involved in cell wall biosynthesis